MREPVVLSLAKMGALLGEVSSGLLLAPQDIDSRGGMCYNCNISLYNFIDILV